MEHNDIKVKNIAFYYIHKLLYSYQLKDTLSLFLMYFAQRDIAIELINNFVKRYLKKKFFKNTESVSVLHHH